MNKHTNIKTTDKTRLPPGAPARAEPAAKSAQGNVRKKIAKETAQEPVHQVMRKEAAKDLLNSAAASEAAENVSPQAAKGDDDLMSKQEKKS